MKLFILRVLAVALYTVISVLFAPISLRAAQPLTLVIGAGGMSCASFLNLGPQDLEFVKAWISGYWSALNNINRINRRVGRFTDVSGIVGEVQITCSQRPSMVLADSVYYVYQGMATRDYPFRDQP